ncbi:hypothetical protein QUA26_12485 [Microcoleus sp. Pol12A4]
MSLGVLSEEKSCERSAIWLRSLKNSLPAQHSQLKTIERESGA